MIKKIILLSFALMLWSTDSSAKDLVIYNAKLYPGPGLPPLEGATISIKDGKIAGVSQSKPQGDVFKIDARGRSVTAGLWNSHVHFTDAKLESNAQSLITNMLLKYGFTSVVDTGSYLPSTLGLIRSIEQGEIKGPDIVIASGSFVYTDGTPSYLPGVRLPEISLPSQAAPAVNKVLDSGAQGIKIFAGSFMSPEKTIHLPPNVIKAITNAAHQKHTFVIAHPTDKTGLENAVNNGVDILAHTAPAAGVFTEETIQTIIDKQVSVIPTLKLWRWELSRHNVPIFQIDANQDIAVNQLKAVYNAGATILFGTDVGYMSDYDPAEEYRLMARSGMDFEAILKSLTTAPAKKFSDNSGVVEIGEPGDLVMYQTNSITDLTFESIDITIKSGEVVFDANQISTQGN
ncbi:MAG: amidohydrolase family protein [Arenicella sp.]|nr:amidohydrolase family protein [Arenicella sp.]